MGVAVRQPRCADIHIGVKMVVMEYFAGSESGLAGQNGDINIEDKEESGTEAFIDETEIVDTTLANSESLAVGSHEQFELEIAEISRLQQLVPTMAAKDNVTQLDIILEAIRYIDCLRDTLEENIDTGDIVTVPSVPTKHGLL